MLDSLPTYENQAAIRFDPDLKTKTAGYRSVEDIILGAANEIFRKPDRHTVTDIAEKFVKITRLVGRSEPWSRDKTPYMVEPQNALTSRELSAVIFVGPSQSGKTESLILNFIAYSVIQDPMDMILFSPTQKDARDFSVRRIDRLNFNSPEMRRRLMKTKAGDNKEMKIYSSGMLLKLSWPTISELAGKPAGRVIITDYDRIDDDIGGEGSAFDLAYMRTTTFGSLRMVVAESSPSQPVEDLRWIASTPHEAPPCKRILGLYNRGDRRRWYWPCLCCSDYFEGKFEHLKWDDTKPNPHDAADTVRMICPSCSHPIPPSDKPTMLEFGVWLKDGQALDAQGNLVGAGPRSHVASFWLNGVAAGFQSWPELVVKHINATREFEQTGSEEALRQFYNNDLGQPYKAKAEELARLPENLHQRAEDLPERCVPKDVRFLIATVDVQKRSFIVQVQGISPGAPYDVTVVDRFPVEKSLRVDNDGDAWWVKPATYLEDWDLLIDRVMLKTYPLDDGSGREMMVKLTFCDSGGFTKHRGEGVTTMAYDFYRQLRKRGLASRFQLVKGDIKPAAPRAWIDYPDQRRKDKLAAARGDVPVLFLNSNVLKDGLAARLDSQEPGKGMIHFPRWLEIGFYRELCAERRTEKGWVNTQNTRNEAWDLLYYCLGVCASQLLQVEKIDWASPPSWADQWDKNPMVIRRNDKGALTQGEPVAYDFSELGKALA